MRRPDVKPKEPWIDADDIGTTVAVLLIVLGIWPLVGMVSLVVPGVVLLWVTIPPRAEFVVKTRPEPQPHRKD